MLAAAPGVFYLHEPFNPAIKDPGVFGARPTRWMRYLRAGDDPRVEDALSELIAFRYRHVAALRAARTPREIARVARDSVRFAAARARRPRALIKDPIALLSAPMFHDRFRARVVVMIRHPAAFCSSLLRLGWGFPFGDLLAQESLMQDVLEPFEDQIRTATSSPPRPLEAAALAWSILHEVIATYQRHYPAWTFTRHEDLSCDPTDGFARLYETLGLSFTSSARKTVLASTASSNPHERPDHTRHVTRLASHENVRSWKGRLSPDEIARIRTIVEPGASRFYSEDEW